MEVKLTTDEQEFQRWFPEVNPLLWTHFNLKRIVIETKQGVAFEWNPMAPREGCYKVHVNWSGKDFDEMRTHLLPIIRSTMYGNFAETYTDNVEKLLEEIREVYPNSNLYTDGNDYRISVRD